MPAKSEAQRRLFAIAEHHPEQLYSENKDLAKVPKKTLHEFAATSEKNLPKHVNKSNYSHVREARKKEGK